MNIILNLNDSIKTKNAIGLIHKVYETTLKNSRIYTASTKTKSEVRGGGKKPWRQKGTGQARAGSTRSPIWKGGGVSFGPKPRNVFKKINKKERKLAILSALYLKRNNIRLIQDSFLDEKITLKTKNFINTLLTLNLSIDQKLLFVLPIIPKSFKLAIKNLKNIEVITADCLNIKQLLHAKTIILSNKSLNIINEIYGKY